VATMIFKRDNLKVGLVFGLLGPILGLIVIYFIKFPSQRFTEFLDFFIHDNKMITSVGSLSLLANVILFTIYINTHRDYTAKGIFLVTLIYGIVILLLKILN
jgi:ABC-type lipoprotein release transport system permease subunit